MTQVDYLTSRAIRLYRAREARRLYGRKSLTYRYRQQELCDVRWHHSRCGKLSKHWVERRFA
jgi:hypothetical protein